MADLFNLTALDELAMYAGLEVEPVLASESAINYMINQYYGVEICRSGPRRMMAALPMI